MISILMPIYNGIEFIDESVYSIINQTFKEWELLIGVNGHLENSDTFQIAKKFEKVDTRIRVYDFHNMKGKSNTLNEMIKYCQYDYVALLDVDDIWIENKLEFQSHLLGKYDIVGTRCIYFGEMEGVVPKTPYGDISHDNFKIVNPIINSSVVLRKELCYWNNIFDGVEDYELWMRLQKQNKTFFNLEYLLVKHRIHKASAFNTKNHDELLDLIKNM